MKDPLKSLDGQLMVMAAHGYCLGRRSYIVSSCISWLREWWDEFETNIQIVIIRDTIQALMRDEAGSEYDAKDWKRFAEWAWKKLDENSKEFVVGSVAYLKEPWPLNGEENNEYQTLG